MNPTRDHEKVVMVLGSFGHEGLNAKVVGLGLSLVRKNLWSSLNNWRKITELLREMRLSGRLVAVIVYSPTPTLLHISHPDFDDAREKLVAELEASRAHIFLHEDAFVAKIEPAPWEITTLTPDNSNNSISLGPMLQMSSTTLHQ